MSAQAAIRDEFSSFGQDAELERLYCTRDWFRLRNALCQESQDWFYRGCVACAFNRLRECHKSFQPIIKTLPQSKEAYEAHKLLSWMYLRRGNFRRVLYHHEKMLAIRHGHPELEAAHALFAILSRFPQQTVAAGGTSTVQYATREGNIFLPARVNGRAFNLMLDSGASISLLTESAARWLGLAIHDAGPEALKLFGATGEQTAFRLTVATDLTIGRFQMTNVVFLVLKDEQFQFPLPYAGALGLSIMLGFEGLCWDANGEFSIGFRHPQERTDKPNLCFDGADLVVEVSFQQQALRMLLDTGNATTVLWPLFARQFANLVDVAGTKGMRYLQGVSGRAGVESAILEDLELRLGGLSAHLSPAPVLSKSTTPNSNWLHGWLGVDTLSEANRVTMDFNAMTLLLE